jgi:hypothetical protein
LKYQELASLTIEQMIEHNLSHEGAMYAVYMAQDRSFLDKERIKLFRAAVFKILAERPELKSHMLPF